MFGHEFAGTGVRIEVPSFDPPRLYTRAEWWKTEDGVLAFQNEVLKYLYYRLKYNRMTLNEASRTAASR
jgi:hypothetical protein